MDIISAATLLFLVMDPLGNIPVFLSVLDDVAPERRMKVLIRELLFALGVLNVGHVPRCGAVSSTVRARFFTRLVPSLSSADASVAVRSFAQCAERWLHSREQLRDSEQDLRLLLQ